jgi:molybdate transport system substrate-binding protein
MSESDPIRILSADAPKDGLRKCCETFSAETGLRHAIELATGPVIKERVAAGRAEADLIVIPRPELEDLGRMGRVVADSIATLGLVTVGVTVKAGAREPDLSSVVAFVDSLLSAKRIIYNTASSGQYVAKMLEKLGLTEKLREKSTILPTGVAVMQELASDKSGWAIGFGHVTEIRRHDKLGTRLVGPLPGEIGRETPYAVGLLKGAARPDSARKLATFLTSPEGKRIFAESGVL